MRLLTFCAALCLLWSLPSHAETAPAHLFTVQARLLKPLDGNKAKPGDSLFLRTLEIAQGEGCTLPVHATVEAIVTSIDHPAAGAHHLVLGLKFAPISCEHAERLMQPLLIAIQVKDDTEQQSSLIRMATAGAENSAIASMFSPSRPGMPTSEDTVLNSKNLAPTVTGFSTVIKAPDLKTGEVRGLRGLTLDLPSKGLASTLSAKKSVYLPKDAGLVLALVPAPAPASTANNAASAAPDTRSALTARTPAPVRPPEEEAPTELCTEGGCQQLKAATEATADQALWSLPLLKLGHQPRPEAIITGLENTSGVHFLGPDQILVTFTLHTLIKRSAEQAAWARKPRRVRAVLLSRQDGHILKVQDWTVPDETGPYVWAYQQDSVLARIGNELVVLGPDLATLQKLSLPGPTVFVSTAPGGDLVLLATEQEKHGQAEHQEMSRYLGPDQPIDEDYKLTALDGSLHPLGSRLLHSRPLQPGILKNAMVSARQTRADRWELERDAWTGQRTRLAQVRSSCPPTISALAGSEVLVRGCTPDQASSTWYRVMNAEGKVSLKGGHSSFELLQQAGTDATGKLFGVASSSFPMPFSFTPQAHAGQFSNLSFSVYGAQKGNLLLAVHLPTGTPESQIFAFSQDGTEAAVMTGGTLRLYAVPQTTLAADASHR